MKIFAIIPAYNEEKMIGSVVPMVARFVNEVVVVDDGSSDDTSGVATRAQAVVLRHVINRGQGAALRTGTDYALSSGADVIVHFDADGQFQPSEIPLLCQPVIDGEVDMVIGSRFLKENESIPFGRKIALKTAIIFTWLFSGLKLSDAHNGFRALSRAAATKIHIIQDRFAHSSEIIDEMARNKVKFKEMPVSLEYTAYSLSRGQKNFSRSAQVLFDLMINKFFQ